ncbi:MAG: VCBS repeat-containing protein [Agriterribacter sp.]
MKTHLFKNLIVLLFALSCLKAAAQTPLFKLLSPKETGVRFSNDINETEHLNVLAYEYFYNGAAVAVGDINNDGLQDMFFTANMKPSKLYLNLGNMKFSDITAGSSKELEGRTNAWKTGATMADVNGDGLLDIYVCYSGKFDVNTRRNQLFINKGNLQFEEAAKQYGLDDPGYSTQAAFFDYDNDDDLDMFLLNHNVKKMDNMELAKFRNEADEFAGNKLFENRDGHFVDVSAKAGIHQFPLTFGLGIAIADINQDGWQDIYVTNDYNEPDYLYLNNHNGTFSEDSKNCFRHLAQFSMGVDIADFNNDALPDICSLDMLPEDNERQKLLQLQENYESFELMQSQDLHKQYMRNMLQLNNGDGTFSEIAQAAGTSNTDWSWCPLLADFDNDGYKDLFVTNGYMRDYTNKDFLRYWGDYKVKKAVDREPVLLMDLVKAMPVTQLSNYIFKNNGDLTFTNSKEKWGIDQQGFSNGAAYVDLDNDGDLDLVVNNLNKEPSIFKNTSREKNRNNYISVKPVYKGKNKNAVGAKVFVYSKNQVQYQELNPNRGYLSCLPLALNFGLGSQKDPDSVKIVWPDNTVQVISNARANQQLTINYKSTDRTSEEKKRNNKALFTRTDGILVYQHEFFPDNDFKRQTLMLFMYSKVGPVIATCDVNNDGRTDVFISGDKTQKGTIYLQDEAGSFRPQGTDLGDESISTTAAAAFFDANGDGHADLYIAKGGYSLIEPGTAPLQDELYLNNGKGNFVLSTGALPVLTASSKSCVAPCDYDNDGDIDLFIGGRVIPGKYPETPRSYLLNNNGKGQFSLVSTALDAIGMVTEAKWFDINKDGRKDLVLAGEFMPISVYINSSTGFINQTNDYFDTPDNGLWFTIEMADVDGDGAEDIIAGNLGLNTQFRFSQQEPAELYYGDFDNNGSIDPFFNFYIQGKSYPFVSRDELNDQMYGMRRRFTSYKAYANADMSKILTSEEMKKAQKLTATESQSVCYFSRNGKFVKTVLPLQAQFSVVTKILANDFDKDGKTDLLLLGNHSDNRLKIGSIDANYGCLLKGNEKDNFEYVPQYISGLSLKGDVKSVKPIFIGTGQYLIIGMCDQPVELYKTP